MKSEVIKKVAVILELTEEEARWLRDISQNQWSKDETPEDRAIREAFFRAVESVR